MARIQNRSLFSQHFLDNRLPELEDWQADVGPALAELRALYADRKTHLSKLNEAQTEQEFIRPVLDLLGFSYVPQTAFKRAGQTQRPDYTLFANPVAKKDALKHIRQERAFYTRGLAILDAKYWARPLSEHKKNDPRDDFKNANPSFQMVNYLVGTSVDWGVLTNGETWRLYYRLASSTATEFYQVNLVELLAQNDPNAFKSFYLFFRRAAFERDAHGKSFLERVREGSVTYARVVGAQLKELVYAQVFPLLAGGFVAQRHAQAIVETETTREEIYQATMALLYKLLFLFYAEARSLLPIQHAGYRDSSLTTMARQVAERLDQKIPFGEKSVKFYNDLLNLFEIVDRGDRNYQLPRYNGGLFSPKSKTNQFLREFKLNNATVAPALEKLWRAEGAPIDYSFIDVRTLGAIYEGLLEYNLVIDDARAGTVHLAEDKRERKSSGSYYTPDYIVKHIVAHTLAPILDQREKQFADAVEHYAALQMKKRRAQNPGTIRALNDELERARQHAIEILLDIKVCDPAMGSGHFLVEAVDYLTDRIIRIINRFPENNPVLEMLERIRKTIVREMREQSIEIESTRLDDTSLLMRVVMKRCVYGVDLNAMAVELAQVSLWLHSFTVGAPLSFLDHHLRWGNSLIGAFARRVQKEFMGEMPLFGSPFEGILSAAKTMQEISRSSDATVADVENSANLYDLFEREAMPYKRLLDIYMMRYFNGKRADEFLRLYRDEALTVKPEKLGEPYRTLFNDREKIFQQKRFFHWDLEFPEVFIDLERTAWHANPGFDAVIGNPPYVDVTADKYYNDFFDAASGRNLYALMLERAGMISRASSRLGMIVPLSLVCAERMGGLRAWFKENYATLRLANFGIRPAKIFPNVEQRVTIVLAEKKAAPADATAIYATRLNRWRDGEEEEMIANLAFSEITQLPDDAGWAKLGDETGRVIAYKLFAQEKHLGDYLNGTWKFFVHGIGRYWLKAYNFEPTYIQADGKPARSSTLFELGAPSEEQGKIFIAIINSSLFFWHWILYGDEFHLTQEEIKRFPFMYHKGHRMVHQKLIQAVDELMQDYQAKSVLKRGKYPTGTITYQEFYPRQSKAIIDRIDDLLGMIYGLTREEVVYLKTFDLQFRTEED
ncbi:MAG: Eco57I restriction-modification methylase domain-containing protein [Chloroflexi bacterium]|nr:Eco57I restriction-modification methylase domain-containing protein [Chloroflexota bacterium]